MPDPIVIKWSQRALHSLFSSTDSPVARWLIDVSDEAAEIARRAVRVRSMNPRDRRRRAGANSTAAPPGYTKALIRPHLGRGTITGQLYGGVNAPGVPGLFLEYPASQMDRKYPFLTTALDEIEARY